jgi:hypothetical protein
METPKKLLTFDPQDKKNVKLFYLYQRLECRDNYFFKIKFVFFFYLLLSASWEKKDMPLYISDIIDTGSWMPNNQSKSRDLAVENTIFLTEWKWFEKNVLQVDVYQTTSCYVKQIKAWYSWKFSFFICCCQHHGKKKICLYIFLISDI